jgi:hypothetical protein
MEETVLFPALLCASDDPSRFRQLVLEHGDERTLVAEMENTLLRERGMNHFFSAGRLTALLRNHLGKEETIFSDLTESWLSKEEDEKVVAEFTRNRKEPEMYANFCRLEWKYPPKPGRDQMSPCVAAPNQAAQLHITDICRHRKSATGPDSDPDLLSGGIPSFFSVSTVRVSRG